MSNSTIISKLIDIAGAANVLSGAADLLVHSYDATPLLAHQPIAVVAPQDVDTVARLLAFANEAGLPVVPRGSGTGLSGGSVPVADGIVLLFPGWNRILEIDEGNLTAWVQPGVITANLHAAVEARGLFYPPDPSSMKICTLGGNVAENSGGLRGLKYGVTADYVMGLEIVLPSGEVLTTGNKCVKDVAGFRLKDIFIGSEGTLGIFTKILVKLIPKPVATKTLLATFDSLSAAGETVSAIIAEKIIPCTLEFLDETTIACVEEHTSAGFPRGLAALLLIEVDGHPVVVAEEAANIERLCRKHGALEVHSAQSAAEAERLKAARRTAFSALARRRPTTILEDATVPRDQLGPMLTRIHEISRKYDLQFGNFGHAGDGNLHPTCLTDERDSAEMHRVEQAFEEIFQAALEFGGTITGEHGIGLAKKQFFARHAGSATLEVMQKLKAALDPNNILNPGKVFDSKPRCENPHLHAHPQPQKAERI